MDQEKISQTALDQMVSSDRTQLLKAAVPYLPPRGRQLLSVYAKIEELRSTISLFSPETQAMSTCETTVSSPLEMLQDIRQYCRGENRRQADQLLNMITAAEIMNIMGESAEKEDDKE